jgi:hypothetical protein
MKTTVEIDEEKLMRVMSLGGFKTRKETLDYALDEAEKKARLRALEQKPFYVTNEDVVDPAYDLRVLRDRDTPGHAHHR